MKKRLIFILLIVGLLSALLIGCAVEDDDQIDEIPLEEDNEIDETSDQVEEDDQADEAASEQERIMAPDLKYEDSNGQIVSLLNLDGQEVSLEDYRGKIIFLNFWATWCVYCDEEMPDLQKLDNENDDLVVIAVDVMEDQSLVEEYIEDGGYEFEVVLDTEGGVAQHYYIGSFPTTYVIREDGTISRYFTGMMTYEIMEDLLRIAREGI